MHRAEGSLTEGAHTCTFSHHALPCCSLWGCIFMMLLPCSQIHILALGTKPQRCQWSFCPSQPASGDSTWHRSTCAYSLPCFHHVFRVCGDRGEGFTNASVDREGWRELCLARVLGCSHC